LVAAKLLDGGGELVEVAAEAGPGHFPHFKPLRPQGVGVDQVGGLIVRDDADPLPLGQVMTGETAHGGGLPGTQEASDHDVAGSHGTWLKAGESGSVDGEHRPSRRFKIL
jgi:hypothetical protein